FTVYTGELRSIIGPNGAGKTTLFRLISGEMKPSAGRIWFQDKEITGRPQHMVVRLGVAKSYQITNIFPHLSLLDEPTAGMSPEETDETMVLIRELARGRTVVLVEHKMKLVMKISDRITVLHQGAFLAEGTPDEIRANPTVQQTYLGVAR